MTATARTRARHDLAGAVLTAPALLPAAAPALVSGSSRAGPPLSLPPSPAASAVRARAVGCDAFRGRSQGEV